MIYGALFLICVLASWALASWADGSETEKY